MSQSPPLQTVATLSSGSSPVPKQAFVWGVPGRPFSVGTRGDWMVEAPGVDAMHVFLNFDGRMIQIASGPSGASATLNGSPIGPNWQPVPIFAEIAFGGARIRVTCEEVQPQRPSGSPPNTAPFEPAAAPAPQPLEQTAYVRPRQLKTQPLTEAAQHAQAYAQVGSTMLHVAEGPRLPYGAGTHAAPGMDPAHMGSQPPPGAQPAAYAPVPTYPTTVGTAPNQPEAEVERDAASTVSDAGALRAHASRVATDPGATHSAYHAHVQRVAVSYDPTTAPQGAAPAYGAPHPAGAAGGSGASPHQTMQSAAPLPLPVPVLDGSAAGAGTEAKPAKEKTSWVMRVVLILLPFAGYFAIFWEPPASEGSAEDTSAVVGASADAPSATTASAGSKGGAAASAGTPAPDVSVAASASPTPAAPSSSAPSVAILAEAASAKTAEKATAAAGSASPVASAAPQNPKLARDALNAAFEGRMDEATARYDRLSAASDSEIYRLSARLLRERAVRKP
jgi:hypothetical protein